ncbi:DUF6705 family protein [Hymenobacter sp. B81]|uniref:DUF6705 family protein n=1 Tax=Hymenobacter sp. B81 TaxID=3344878 RepID=UPI0037DBF86F
MYRGVLLFLFSLLLAACSFAQSAPSQPSEAFLGTWEWRSGADVFRIRLSRDLAFPMPRNEVMHAIVGRHSYTRNGVLVEESFSHNPTDPKTTTLMGSPHTNELIILYFDDLTRGKSGKARLSINPTQPNQLQFTLHGMEQVSIGGTLPPAGFTIPTSMTLTRVP